MNTHTHTRAHTQKQTKTSTSSCKYNEILCAIYPVPWYRLFYLNNSCFCSLIFHPGNYTNNYSIQLSKLNGTFLACMQAHLTASIRRKTITWKVVQSWWRDRSACNMYVCECGIVNLFSYILIAESFRANATVWLDMYNVHGVILTCTWPCDTSLLRWSWTMRYQ